jgi:DNA-binding transcriptional ArsR family regulator
VPINFAAAAGKPLYEIKANLFKALAHPARIRVLEILSANARPTTVSEILSDTELEPTLLSQHLAVLKRHQVVRAERVGNAVYYELAHPPISELLVTARTFLAHTLRTQQQQLEHWTPCHRSVPSGDREGGRHGLAIAPPSQRLRGVATIVAR